MPPGYWTIWTTVALDLVGFGIVAPILGRYAERFGAARWQQAVEAATRDMIAELAAETLAGKLAAN